MPEEYEREVVIQVGEPSNTELDSADGVIATSINTASVESVSGGAIGTSNLSFGDVNSNVNLSQQNAFSNQQRLNQLNVGVLGKTVNKVSNYQPKTVRSELYALTDNSLAETLSDLRAALEAFNGSGGSKSPVIPSVPHDWHDIVIWIETLIECLLYSGAGTYQDPLTIDSQIAKVYLRLNFQLGLKEVPPDDVDISGSGLQIRKK